MALILDSAKTLEKQKAEDVPQVPYVPSNRRMTAPEGTPAGYIGHIGYVLGVRRGGISDGV